MQYLDVHLPHDEGSRWSPPPSLIHSPTRSSAKSSSVKASKKSSSEETKNQVYSSPLVAALTELVHGYRKPAMMTDDKGTLVCMNAAAGRMLGNRGEQETDGKHSPTNLVELQTWEHKAKIQADGHTFYLIIPDAPDGGDNSKHAAKNIYLPPRLAKIAQLVISGCTDKQIAVHTGLSFSTVRTYVRQIYRRIGVHSRVELVHVTNKGLTIRKSNE